jgi:hypothetical protein
VKKTEKAMKTRAAALAAPLIAALAILALSGCLSSGGLAEKEADTQKKASTAEAARKKSDPGQGDGTGKGLSDLDDHYSGTVKVSPRERPLLRVRGEPDGAEVWIDEVYMGRAPVEAMIPAGFHRIRVEMDGYRVWTDDPYYDAASIMTVRYLLEPRIGYIRLQADPVDALVTLEGWGDLGPGLNEAPEGLRTVRASRFGYRLKILRVTVMEDRETELSFSLEPKDMEIGVDARPSAFNPDEPGALGRASLRAIPDGYGYARISVLDASGAVLAEKAFPFVEDYGDLVLGWDGKDGGGKSLPAGEYEARFESWPMLEPLEDGAFPETPPGSVSRLTLRITDERRSFLSLMSGVPGLAYCPDAEILKGAVQLGIAGAGTYVSPELWFGRLDAQVRLPGFGKALPWEMNASLGLEAFRDAMIAPAFGLGWKTGLADIAAGTFRFKDALAVKATIIPLGVVIDPYGNMLGASVSLPQQFGFGKIDAILCPELLVTPYAVGDAASAADDPWSRPWNFLPYARAGLRGRAGAGIWALSGFCRFTPLGGPSFAPDPPYGVAAEAIMADAKTGTRYGVCAMLQFESLESWYVLMGISLGGIWPLGD